MGTKRVFLHVDMDAFFASVEQHDKPELKGQPVVVGAPPDQRGVISAASYKAREYGIHSAMPSREAYRRCPAAVFLPVNMERYLQVSQQIRTIMESFTPLVEPLSIDEAFLDVTGAQRLFGSGATIAAAIKADILNKTGLTASVGVASNKFLAKLASDLDKPDGLTIVPEGRREIMAFLAPLPVGRIWGVGKVTGRKLTKAGIRTIGDLQVASSESLAHCIGKHSAGHLQRLACGEDAREIELDREEKSMSREYTFPEDCQDVERLSAVLDDLVEDVARRLRAVGKYASVAQVKLRWQGFETITRQRKLSMPLCDGFQLRALARDVLCGESLQRPVRLIGFSATGLTTQAGQQLMLFDQQDGERKETLSRVVDSIRNCYGDESIGRCCATKRKDDV